MPPNNFLKVIEILKMNHKDDPEMIMLLNKIPNSYQLNKAFQEEFINYAKDLYALEGKDKTMKKLLTVIIQEAELSHTAPQGKKQLKKLCGNFNKFVAEISNVPEETWPDGVKSLKKYVEFLEGKRKLGSPWIIDLYNQTCLQNLAEWLDEWRRFYLRVNPDAESLELTTKEAMCKEYDFHHTLILCQELVNSVKLLEDLLEKEGSADTFSSMILLWKKQIENFKSAIDENFPYWKPMTFTSNNNNLGDNNNLEEFATPHLSLKM